MANFNDDLARINYLTGIINKIKLIGDKALENLYHRFHEYDLQPTQIEDNFFNFYFWGLKFIVKSEITFNSDTKQLNNGELNTYLIVEDGNKLNHLLIVSYSFDELGNIENHFSVEHKEFSRNYYIDFCTEVMDYRYKDGSKLKFQLK